MSLKPTFRLLSILIAILSIFLLIPATIEYFETENLYLFKISIVSILSSIPIWYFSRKAKSFSNKDVFLVIVLCWIAASFFGSIPFYLSDSFDGYSNALFEAVSGVTTTGATIIEDIESMPKSILFWRSFLQWFGGLGIVIFTIALLPLLGVSGEKIFNLEYPGPSSEKITPRIKDTGSWPINCSPKIKACARPSGDFWIVYEIFIPSCAPSPNKFSNLGVSSGVEIINISLIPANIKVDKG